MSFRSTFPKYSLIQQFSDCTFLNFCSKQGNWGKQTLSSCDVITHCSRWQPNSVTTVILCMPCCVKTSRHPQNWKYIAYCIVVRAALRWQITCRDNFVKFICVYFGCKHTDRQTDMLIAVLYTLPSGKGRYPQIPRLVNILLPPLSMSIYPCMSVYFCLSVCAFVRAYS